jgi:hypothetical protein
MSEVITSTIIYCRKLSLSGVLNIMVTEEGAMAIATKI